MNQSYALNKLCAVPHHMVENFDVRRDAQYRATWWRTLTIAIPDNTTHSLYFIYSSYHEDLPLSEEEEDVGVYINPRYVGFIIIAIVNT